MIDYSNVVKFHGHSCVGLAMGYKAVELAVQKLGLSFSGDEEVVAVAETDSCMVDAVQAVLGCTAGKGNLFINKWGKSAFSFFRRDNNTSIRLVVDDSIIPVREGLNELREKVKSGTITPEESDKFHKLSDEVIAEILAMPADKIFKVTKTEITLPKKAQIYNNVICSCCGEAVAEGMTVKKNGKLYCIPCSKKE